MEEYKYVYGVVPSRRLGLSLGISPIPKKTCNYSCIYCQLGRTDRMTNTREMFYKAEDILKELEVFLKTNNEFDVVTIVGEGEPTLYSGLGELIDGIHKAMDKPVAVITNGALLYLKEVKEELMKADIVLPTLDAYDEDIFKRINRPHGSLQYSQVLKGLEDFSKEFTGQLWIELMLIEGINDRKDSWQKYKKLLENIKYDKLYLNTPVRPPAEEGVNIVDNKIMKEADEMLGGICIDLLVSEGFKSEKEDDYEAVLSIIKRHPMNQYEIEGFLKTRGRTDIPEIFGLLNKDNSVDRIEYRGYITYRLQ